MKHKNLLKIICSAALIAAAGITICMGSLSCSNFNKAQVYFTDDISAEGIVKLYEKINGNIKGKVAIKWHSGEPNGPNIIPRDMVMALQKSIPGSVLVETNTLYERDRYTTKQHRETLKINGWDFCPVDIMDEDGAVMLPIKG